MNQLLKQAEQETLTLSNLTHPFSGSELMKLSMVAQWNGYRVDTKVGPIGAVQITIYKKDSSN
jgi:hypothetical protein